MKPKSKILLIFLLVLIFSMPAYAMLSREVLPGTSPENPYLVYSEEDLRKIGNDPDWTLNKHYKLMNDIILPVPNGSKSNWVPIGSLEAPFTGSFNGNNKTVKNIYLINTCLKYIGFFGAIQGEFTKIENLGLLDVSIFESDQEHQSAGSLVGINKEGTIINCYANGSVEVHGNSIGGLIGVNYGFIKYCNYSGYVNGKSNTGGLIGTSEGYVISCYAESNILNGANSGGLIGYVFSIRKPSIIKECFSGGEVYSKSFSGGLVGKLENSTIEDCFSYANVTGFLSTGGIAGEAWFSNIERCYFSGTITQINSGYASATYIGGIVGCHDSIIKDCLIISMSQPTFSYSTAYFENLFGYGNSEKLSNNLFLNVTSISENCTLESIFDEYFTSWEFSSENPIWFFEENMLLPLLCSIHK